MSTLNENSNSRINGYAVNYLPAKFKKNKSGWLIEYYAENPETKKLCRKQIKLNRLAERYRTQKEAIVHINKIIININLKLSSGWNPYFEGEDVRLYLSINTVLEKFLKEKEKEQRPDSIRSYKSFLSIIQTWINKNYPDICSSLFSELHAAKFMDYAYNDRGVGTTTYNNYLNPHCSY
ncbi:hypothetical protein FACS189437_04480 [Bacteroidia bacterium]|nr:hypothetical protein FACS189437_04480 [Bacteroidia bacterium]